MITIDYVKYSNMNERQLLNSLLNAEKKEAKLKSDLQEKIKSTAELIKFLRAKLKEQIDKPRYYTTDNAPSLKFIKNEIEKMPQDEVQKIKNEVDKQMFGE